MQKELEVIDNVAETDTTADYIETINQLKQNSVSKDEYMKLKNENKQLLNAIASNQVVEVAAEPEIDIKEVRENVFKNHSNLSNREFVDNVVKLYDYELEHSGKNIFMPNDPNYIPTQDDINQVDNMVTGFKNALEEANGNDLIFNQYMERILK